MSDAARFEVHVLTIFPEAFTSFLEASLLGKARASGLVSVRLWNIRDFATDKHHSVDDVPYGGGSGMVMKAEPLVAAMEALRAAVSPIQIFLLAPHGRPLGQADVRQMAALPRVGLVCGRYEGFDERVTAYADGVISIGDYVVSGGEAPALVLLDAMVRLIPGVLGNQQSVVEESFSDTLLEYPQYTRPPVFRDAPVPDILTSGDHERVRRWRRAQALRRTRALRPDLFARHALTDEDRRLLDDDRE